MNPSPRVARGAVDRPPPGAGCHGREASILKRAAPACTRAGRCGSHRPARRPAPVECGRDAAGRRLALRRSAVPVGATGEGTDEAYAGVAAVAGEEGSDTLEVGTISLATESDESNGENGLASTDRDGQVEAEGDSPSVSNEPEQEPEPEGMDKSEAPYKIGDVVVGRVLWCNDRGAKIELLDYEGHQGFVSRRHFPYRLLEPGRASLSQPKDLLVGCVREFEIVDIPDRIIPYKVGPLLNARKLDKGLMMARMEQMYDVSQQDREVWKIKVLAANNGGLKVLLAGRVCFVPKSHIQDDEIKHLTQEEFLEKYKDRELAIAIIQVDPIDDRVVVSMKRAEQYIKLKSIRPGSLVWGTVRKVVDWGAFFGVDGTRESALIHRSNISKGRFSSVQDIFRIGDRVCAVVLGMEDNYTRLSCGTSDLEEQPGDMVKDRQYVYEHAEEQMERIRDILAEREDGIYDDDLQEFAS